MPRCPNLNCEPRDVVKATTDIAGPGVCQYGGQLKTRPDHEQVLYSYLVSAILAILAIVYGYLSDSLPDSYLNETDRTVIASFQKCLPSDKNAARMQVFYRKVKSMLLFGRPLKPHRKLTRRQREEVVKRFILTLSDQQLVAGLAVLVAAIANQCTLTVWEFQLAFSLAWFSSTTHLATLDCLRQYFLDHGTVRNWRVFGMLALLILLMYSLVMSMSSVDGTIPVQCTFHSFGEKGLYKGVSLDTFDILSAVLTLVLLVWQYLVRILWSYKRNDDKATSLERTMFKLRTKRHRKVWKPSKRELAYMIEEAVMERESFRRRRNLEQIRNSRGLRRHWLIAYRASESYSRSFLSLGPMLTFMVSFGFTQLNLNRWDPSVRLEIDSSMGIGQIIPLFLLVLPVLAAAESYCEVQESTESAQSNAIARENADAAAAARSRGHTHSSNFATFPPQTDFQRAYDSIERRNLEPLDPSGDSEDYNNPLLDLKRFFYIETKVVNERTAALRTEDPGNQNEKTLSSVKAHLVSSYHLLVAQETALRVTTLTSLIENTCCGLVSASLGILIYIENSGEATKIASFVLFGLSVVYKTLDYATYVLEAWFEISEADYQRLMMEARNQQNGTECQTERRRVQGTE